MARPDRGPLRVMSYGLLYGIVAHGFWLQGSPYESLRGLNSLKQSLQY